MFLVTLIFAFLRGIIWIPTLWIGSTLITFENFHLVLKNEDYRTKQKILETFIQMVLAQLLPPFYPLFCVAKAISDHIWKPTPLHAVKKSVLLQGIDTTKNVFSWTRLPSTEIRSLVDQLEIVDGDTSLFHVIVLGNSSHACCIENTIYMKGKVLYDGVLKHEATHAAQFYVHKGRFVGFLTVYFAQFVSGFLTNGYNAHAAYRNIEAEKHAYAIERAHRGYLHQSFTAN